MKEEYLLAKLLIVCVLTYIISKALSLKFVLCVCIRIERNACMPILLNIYVFDTSAYSMYDSHSRTTGGEAYCRPRKLNRKITHTHTHFLFRKIFFNELIGDESVAKSSGRYWFVKSNKRTNGNQYSNVCVHVFICMYGHTHTY